MNIRFEEICKTESGRLPEAESYSPSEPNVLLLDQARWSWNDGPLEAREEMLRLDGKLRTRLGLKPRNGLGCQPWADTEPAPILGVLTLQFDFDSEQTFEGCELASEDPGSMEVVFNGGAVTTDSNTGWWVDRCIRKIALPPVRQPDRQELN